MSAVLVQLIRYYLACLEKERRDDLTQHPWELSRHLVPLESDVPEDWGEAKSSPATVEVAARLSRQENLAALFAPLVHVSASGHRFEPVAGVFCTAGRGGLQVDPADNWIGPILSTDSDPESMAAAHAGLERAAAVSPKAFADAITQAVRDEDLPEPQECLTLDALRDMPHGSIALFPAFWLIEVHASYDRGLVRELERLIPLIQTESAWKNTALRFLVIPPKRGDVSLDAIKSALDNPAALTFSQARALAACAQPLTVVTGPPGTGKTRLIAALGIEHLIAGQSLLLASRINMAVDSAVLLIERLLGRGAILRTGNQEARTELVETAGWLAGRNGWPGTGELFHPDGGDAHPLHPAEPVDSHALDRGVKRLRRLADHLGHQGETPPRWWQWLTHSRLRRFEREWHGLVQQADQLFQSLDSCRAGRSQALRRQLDQLVQRSQSRLNYLTQRIESDRRARHRAFRDFAQMGFPLAVTNLTVSTNLPLEPGIFDTVVIDEASTCDPASLLPLLYRAKQAVIVGDDKQLPHITGKGWKQVEPIPLLRGADGLEFAAEFGMSAFHLCSALIGDERRFELADHFRCPPPIIAFSNEAFYGGRLRIHTEERENAVSLRLVAGQSRTTRLGSRVNEAQLRAGLEELERFVCRAPDSTYGFVTPYKAMADAAIAHIEKETALAPLLSRERLLVGTVHKFQGNEVDYLVFVTVAGENATERELKWIEEAHLFNVAVTRARRSLVVIADPHLWERGRLPLTAGLLRASAVMIGTAGTSLGSLPQAVSEHLDSLGIAHRLGVAFRGYPLDILDGSDPPSWAIQIYTWSELQPLATEDILRVWGEDRSLRRWGVETVSVNALNWREAISAWLAEREISTALFKQV